MRLGYSKVMNTMQEFQGIDRTNPYNVVGLTVHTICNYSNEELFYTMLTYIMGPQEITPLYKSRIKDRMMDDNKYTYIGNSYFVGTTPSDNYALKYPLEIEIVESTYQAIEENYLRFDITCSGADTKRQITLRKGKDNNWYLWGDCLINLLVDIKKEDNFWA